MGVVLPGRSVHEGVERIAIDDELALPRDEKDLPAAAWKVAPGELIQPRRRGRCSGHGRTGFGRGGAVWVRQLALASARNTRSGRRR